jgi:hypothetical protein
MRVAAISDIHGNLPVDDQLVAYLVDPPASAETTEYFESLRAT